MAEIRCNGQQAAIRHQERSANDLVDIFIKRLAEQLLNAPVRIEVAPRYTPAETVAHSAIKVDGRAKHEALERLRRWFGGWQMFRCLTLPPQGIEVEVVLAGAEPVAKRSANSPLSQVTTLGIPKRRPTRVASRPAGWPQ